MRGLNDELLRDDAVNNQPRVHTRLLQEKKRKDNKRKENKIRRKEEETKRRKENGSVVRAFPMFVSRSYLGKLSV